MTVQEGDLSVSTENVRVPASAAEEKIAILGILEESAAKVKEGDKHYLVAARWWREWSNYIGSAVPSNDTLEPGPVYCSNYSEDSPTNPKRPSKIDNSELVIKLKRDDDIELREKLLENHDYILLPEQVWMAFHKWYGGGPTLARRVISTVSVENDHLAVEVYPLRIRLNVSPNEAQLIVKISKQDTVGELYQQARKMLNLGSEIMRIWDYFGKIKHGLMDDHKQTLEDADIGMDHEVLLEVQVDGNWPKDNQSSLYENGSTAKELALVTVEPSRSSFSVAGGPSGSRNFGGSSSPDAFYSHSLSSPFDDLDGGYGKSGPVGLTGLQNLGNTCFMNSALQCLVHTPQLVDFFLQDYSHEINRQNPLGMEGELAIAFGDLLRKLWAPGRQPVMPRAFKLKLARFAPQFSGYNQHDSQELLAFLLDGLHEDLNRVKHKPYIESKETDNRPDEIVAHETWENHRARNDSIIVDVCQGQYKSTLVCPVCSEVSVTFDPFMYLSLPLPSTTFRTLPVTVFSSDGSSLPTPYTVSVPKQGRCRELISAIGKACGLRDDERLLLKELYNSRQFRILEEYADWLSFVHDDGLLTAHRLPKNSERTALLIFLNRHLQKDANFPVKTVGSPLISCIPDEGLHTGADLLKLFEKLLQPLKRSIPSRLPEMATENGCKQNGKTDNHMEEDMDVQFEDGMRPSSGEDQFVGTDKSNSFKQEKPFFQFFLTDEKLMGREALIDLDWSLPAIFLSPRVNGKIYIAVNWSEKALEQYDMKHLEIMPEGSRSGVAVKKPRQEALSLYNCLEAFLKEEPLGPEDMWYCPRCKEHRQASKKLDLWRLPAILVVHLKRFSYSRYLKNKLETFVNFPVHNLDLTRYTPGRDSAVYELYAISNHYGSMGGGHYTAYVKLLDEKRWYNFDDSHVSPVGEDEIKTSAAYVLFYRRIRTDNGMSNNGILNHGLSN